MKPNQPISGATEILKDKIKFYISILIGDNLGYFIIDDGSSALVEGLRYYIIIEEWRLPTDRDVELFISATSSELDALLLEQDLAYSLVKDPYAEKRFRFEMYKARMILFTCDRLFPIMELGPAVEMALRKHSAPYG